MPGVSRRQVLAGGATGIGMAGAAAAGAFGAGWRPFEAAQAVNDGGGYHVGKVKRGNDMNVVLIVVDETRRDHIGAYGSSVRTPNIDAFAASGVRFTRPYPESMPTVPVRRAVHTGLRSYPFRDWHPWHGLPPGPGWQPVPQDQATLAEMLGKAGYTCVLLADTPMYFRPSMDLHRGYAMFDWTRGQGFDFHGLRQVVPKKDVKRYLAPKQRGTAWGKNAVQYLANALTWHAEAQWPVARLCSRAVSMLGTLAGIQPFLLVVDTFEPHGPWFPPPRYANAYGEYRGAVEPILPTYGKDNYLNSAQIARTDQLYSGEITFTDRWLGRVFDALSSHGLHDNTLVLLLSDHGVLLGGAPDHGLIGKPGAGLYPGLTDIMMFARSPRRPHGVTSDMWAHTHDITPTILGELDVKVERELDGANVLDPHSAAARRTYATAMYAYNVWARDDRYVLIAPHYGKTKRLYDTKRDPGLKHDISAAKPEVVKRLWGYALKDAGGHFPRYHH